MSLRDLIKLFLFSSGKVLFPCSNCSIILTGGCGGVLLKENLSGEEKTTQHSGYFLSFFGPLGSIFN